MKKEPHKLICHGKKNSKRSISSTIENWLLVNWLKLSTRMLCKYAVGLDLDYNDDQPWLLVFITAATNEYAFNHRYTVICLNNLGGWYYFQNTVQSI